MARIRSSRTGPERILAEALEAAGIPAEWEPSTPAGRADLGYPDLCVAIYVDGCYFHGCPEHYVRPRTRAEFWSHKLAGNVERDISQTRLMLDRGWAVVRAWECDVRHDTAGVLARVIAARRGDPGPPEPAWRVHSVEVLDPLRDLERRRLVSLWDLHTREDRVRHRTTHKHGRKET